MKVKIAMFDAASVYVRVTLTQQDLLSSNASNVMTCALTGGKHAAARMHAALAGTSRTA